MNVKIGGFHCDSPGEYDKAYSILARKAGQWFERAGGLALTVFITEGAVSDQSDQSNILFDTLLSYSSRWKKLQFTSSCTIASTPITRIAALSPVDVPLLQSVSLQCNRLPSSPVFRDSEFLTTPSLKHVTLQALSVRDFTVNWAVLTSLTLHGGSTYSESEMARILQQTKSLVFCDIVMGSNRSEEHYRDTISLPILKTLILRESPWITTSSGSPTILGPIITPILEKFDIHYTIHDLSLTNFLKRSPHILKLSLPYVNEDEPLNTIIRLLRLCPSLTALSVRPHNLYMSRSTLDADSFLRAFVEEGDAGVLCPRLQYFDFTGNVNFTLQTLGLFFEGKQGELALPSVLPWKRVVVRTGGLKAMKTQHQILDLVSQKKAAGLDVEVIF